LDLDCHRDIAQVLKRRPVRHGREGCRDILTIGHLLERAAELSADWDRQFASATAMAPLNRSPIVGVIEQRSFVRLDYVRVQARDDFETWWVENGWANALGCECEPAAALNMRGIWFLVARYGTRCYVYKRTASGLKAVF
jgi:hypothetical protein